MKRCHLLCVGCVLLITSPLTAQSPASQPATTLRVATRHVPPFSIHTDNGEWEGLTIDLWRDIATKFNLEYKLIDVDLDDMLGGLQAGKFDVAAAALTMTAEREAAFDFSHPFYPSGLGIAVSSERGSGWGEILRSVVSLEFFSALAVLFALLLGVGVVIWAFERRKNTEEFGGTAAEGIGSGFWWSAVTMTTVGYGDKSPKTFGGRMVGLVWMFASILLISSVTAAIASALTASQLDVGIAGPDDLSGERIGTVAGSTGEDWLVDRRINSTGFVTPEAALQALADGSVKAVVYDEPILRYLIRQTDYGSIRVLPSIFEPQNYAIAMKQHSPLGERINQAILETTATEEWRKRVGRYLGN